MGYYNKYLVKEAIPKLQLWDCNLRFMGEIGP
jgi:hypothetical protein